MTPDERLITAVELNNILSSLSDISCINSSDTISAIIVSS